MKTKIQEKFKAMFGDGASLFASPGRVNLIGEHTDYNLGFVLPGAIDKAIYVALKPNDGTVCRVYSLDYDETVELNLHGEKPSQQWACYVYGVCQEMEKRGALILPFDMAFGGDVPLGAGLSSSAALESAVGFALVLDGLSRAFPKKREFDADVLLLYAPDTPPAAVARAAENLAAEGVVRAETRVPPGFRAGRTVTVLADGTITETEGSPC